MYDFVAITTERSNQCRGHAQRRHFVAIYQRPDAAGSGEIWGTVVKHHCRAEQQSSEDLPRSHHPTHIRHPEKCFVRVQIESLPHVLCGLNREAAMRMHRSFWLTSGASCVA